ncbi:MAG: hypothetical protein RLY14_1107, partial [Planctomycetota bacterium]
MRVLVRQTMVSQDSLMSSVSNRHRDDALGGNGCDDGVRDGDANGNHKRDGLSHESVREVRAG